MPAYELRRTETPSGYDWSWRLVVGRIVVARGSRAHGTRSDALAEIGAVRQHAAAADVREPAEWPKGGE